MKIVAGVSIGILAIVGAVSWHIYGEDNYVDNPKEYEIVEEWELPEILTEISAVAYLDSERVAAVQDEDGSIFIYNLSASELEDEIRFFDAGDYEGLAIHQEDAYVLRSDGKIFAVRGFQNESPKVEEYETELSQIEDIDLEGLSMNASEDGLLIASKNNSEESEDYKIIQELQFQGQEMTQVNRWHLDMNDPAFAEIDEKKENKFSPSAIRINPETGDWYLLDGKNPKLLITDHQATPKLLIDLSKSDFPQPEGLMFAPDGSLYISSEGGKGKGKIAKVILKQDAEEK